MKVASMGQHWDTYP